MSDAELEDAVRLAQAGDKDALARLVEAVQNKIYYLALRMLWDPQDAEDAAQEIVVRIITRLSTFEFRSAFTTWVYRVASNHLLDVLDRRPAPGFSFEEYKQDLEVDLEDPAELMEDAEYGLLLNEVRIGCTMAMLLCLDQKHRLAYILGDILELDHNEASAILETSRANYRQRLSRARSKVVAFTRSSCGLVSDDARCRCDRKLEGAIRRGRVDPAAPAFAPHCAEPWPVLKARLEETRADLRTLELQQAVPRFESPSALGDEIARLIDGLQA